MDILIPAPADVQQLGRVTMRRFVPPIFLFSGVYPVGDAVDSNDADTVQCTPIERQLLMGLADDSVGES